MYTQLYLSGFTPQSLKSQLKFNDHARRNVFNYLNKMCTYSSGRENKTSVVIFVTYGLTPRLHSSKQIPTAMCLI